MTGSGDTTDRLDWIFDSGDGPEDGLAAKYDRWAATYDQDHDEWGWGGPNAIATAVADRLGDSTTATRILDAGCGTGRVGVALRETGVAGSLVGIDLSAGMLARAEALGIYESLEQGSLEAMPFDDGAFDGVVSAGVLTHGHVEPPTMRELARVVRPGGLVAITQRLDLADRYAPMAAEMTEQGTWTEVHRSAPTRFHPDRDDSEQFVIVWQVS